MNKLPVVDVLMVGKTGNGKSGLGNSILKRYAFDSKCSSGSVTKDIASEYGEYKGRILKVVDSPGVGDTHLDTPEAVNLIVKTMGHAIIENPRGYHAFLLVVRFGGRFTKEDIETVEFLKCIFGKDFVQRFCILVFTCGDDFEGQMKKCRSNQTFDQWCQEQDSVISQLLKECDNRYVLFDNMTEDEQKQDAQIDRLLELLDGLQSQGIRYTDDNFKRAQVERDRAVVASKEPMIREEVVQETSLIMQKQKEKKTKYQDEQQIPHLRELETRCGDFIKYLQEQDKGTGALSKLIKSMTDMKQSVRNMIEIQTEAAKKQKKMEGAENNLKTQFDQKQQELDDNTMELIVTLRKLKKIQGGVRGQVARFIEKGIYDSRPELRTLPLFTIQDILTASLKLFLK